MTNIVVIGAGMVGRGLLGELFAAAGWRIHFVDLDEVLIDELNRGHGYSHTVVDNDTTREGWVAVASAVPAQDTQGVVSLLVDADLAATAVGARTLPNLAPLFARAVGARERSGRPVLNVLLCENLHDADGVMRELIAAEWAIDAPPGRIGLIRTSIGRMVPVASPRARVTSVRVEPYGYLPVDAAAFVGHVELPARVIVDRDVSFDFYADRKLYIHNMGHFIAALLGRAAGLVRMDEVMDDWRSRYLVRAAMVEVAAALARRYNRPMAGLLAHIDDLLYRFGNRGLADTVDRVARDPARKMQPGDRMLGAVELCRQQHVPCPHVELGVWLGEAAVADRPVSQEDVIERVAETYRTLAAAGYV